MKKLMLISIAFIMVACSTVNFQDAGPRLAVQYATAKFIEGGDTKKRALAIVNEVNKAQTLIDVQVVPLSDIKLQVIERVRSRGLSPADTLLASTLINSVDLKIQEDFKTGVLNPDDTIRINAVLDLIKQAARLYL